MLKDFLKIESDINNTFSMERSKFFYFPNPEQCHPEIELIHSIQGVGPGLSMNYSLY